MLTLALYMPNTKQAPMNGACGGQVVVFAYVFDASAMEWYFVVIFCLLNPVPRLKLTRSASCPAQTVYTQNGVDVKGFPSAVVVDQNCIKTVVKLHLPMGAYLGPPHSKRVSLPAPMLEKGVF